MTVDSFHSFTSALSNSLYAIDHPLRSEVKSDKTQLLLIAGIAVIAVLMLRRFR